MTSLKLRSMEKYHVNSAMAGTSVCSTMVATSGSMPAAIQSLTISSVSWRISDVRSNRVVKACMFASRK